MLYGAMKHPVGVHNTRLYELETNRESIARDSQQSPSGSFRPYSLKRMDSISMHRLYADNSTIEMSNDMAAAYGDKPLSYDQEGKNPKIAGARKSQMIAQAGVCAKFLHTLVKKYQFSIITFLKIAWVVIFYVVGVWFYFNEFKHHGQGIHEFYPEDVHHDDAIIKNYYGAAQHRNALIMQCIYFITFTVTTIGYGAPAPISQKARCFTVFYVLVGIVMVFSVLSEITYAVIQWNLKKNKNKSQSKKKAKKKSLIGVAVRKTLETFLWWVLLFFIMLGGAGIFRQIESGQELTFIDAFYFCAITSTSVGYGDINPETLSGKLFLVFYMLIAVSITGIAVEKATSLVQRIHEADYEQAIDELTFSQYLLKEAKEFCETDTLRRSDYILYMLVLSGKIADSDLQMWLRRFDEFDVNKDMALDDNDLRAFQLKEARTSVNDSMKVVTGQRKDTLFSQTISILNEICYEIKETIFDLFPFLACHQKSDVKSEKEEDNVTSANLDSTVIDRHTLSNELANMSPLVLAKNRPSAKPNQVAPCPDESNAIDDSTISPMHNPASQRQPSPSGVSFRPSVGPGVVPGSSIDISRPKTPTSNTTEMSSDKSTSSSSMQINTSMPRRMSSLKDIELQSSPGSSSLRSSTSSMDSSMSGAGQSIRRPTLTTRQVANPLHTSASMSVTIEEGDEDESDDDEGGNGAHSSTSLPPARPSLPPIKSMAPSSPRSTLGTLDLHKMDVKRRNTTEVGADAGRPGGGAEIRTHSIATDNFTNQNE